MGIPSWLHGDMGSFIERSMSREKERAFSIEDGFTYLCMDDILDKL